MTPNDILSGVRTLLNDKTPPYRNGNDELLGRINDCLGVMLDMRPDLFITSDEHTCTAGAEQVCTFERLRQVVEVPRVVGGNALTVADRLTLDQFRPGWYQDTEADAQHWIQHPKSIERFYLYPPSPAGQVVEVRFLQAHAAITALDSVIDIPENYQSAIEAFVVNRAESKDDEHVNSGRAAAFMSDFAGMIGAGGK
jgi:hypothetical protein